MVLRAHIEAYACFFPFLFSFQKALLYWISFSVFRYESTRTSSLEFYNSLNHPLKISTRAPPAPPLICFPVINNKVRVYLTIYGPMIYTAPSIRILMRADGLL
jgi:hypothetical protein